MEFKCKVDGCQKTIRSYYSTRGCHCPMHEWRLKTYGSATPIRICHGCKKDFAWIDKAFRAKPHCNDCIDIFIKYIEFVDDSSFAAARHHHINPVDFIKLLISQDFKCAFPECNKKIGNGFDKIVIDHDHKCCPGVYGCLSCVRGLVCWGCNMAIGLIERDMDIISKFEMYNKKKVF